jgi:hypothetical protein
MRFAGQVAALMLFTAFLVAAAEGGSRQGENAESAVRLVHGPFETGIIDPASFSGPEASLAFRRTSASGATTVRLLVSWRGVAPQVRRSGFRPADPDDPGYRWETVDRQVRLAFAHGLSPIICIVSAPDWAEGGNQPNHPGTVRPDRAELGLFATAAARRYSGSVAGLPRVRYWQVWNEPNLLHYLTPQYVGRRAASAVWYRAMVNAFSTAVHSVHADNVVIAGGLAPFTTHTGDRAEWGVGPLEFMREMLCVSRTLRPTCSARSQFDVWSHHPYTSGGPNHHATLPSDVSIPDLPEMRRLLDAAVRHGRVSSRQRVRFWVTEFSWDTSPPDPKGVPGRLHARWVAEALFRMWRSGVSLVTWFQLRDDEFPDSLYQSGLYFRGATAERDRPKPALRAFRFPFVALPEKGRAVTWGRTPRAGPGSVVLQLRANGRWLPLARVRANRHGIFGRRIQAAPRRLVRAVFVPTGETSLPFRVVRTRDRPMFAFGTLPR